MIDLLNGLDIENMDEKTADVLKQMSANLDAAIKSYMADTMTKEELNKQIGDAVKSIDNNAELESVKNQLADAQKSLLTLKAKTENGVVEEVKSMSLEAQIEEQLKDFITDVKGKKMVDLKAACMNSKEGNRKHLNITMSKKDASSPITTAGANKLVTAVDDVISGNPKASSIIRQYANVAKVSSRSLTYAQLTTEGAAAWVAEGGTKPIMEGELEEVTINAAKVALGAKLTEEALVDLPQLVAEIKAEIVNKIGLKEEVDILTGNGQSGTIKGVTIGMPAFTLTGVSIDNPTIVDVIVAAYTQIVSTSNMVYAPNLVLVNPIDWANMSRAKDAQGRPLNENLNDILPTGLNVVPSNAVAVGKILVGDFNYLNIRDYVELSIEFGWENDDFTKNLVTMIGEKRLFAYIKNQYKTAFVYDSIATIKSAIANA